VLAASIVLVFFIGWIKLWWAQRILAKHALLDEEKRTRQMELRKSGLPIGRRVDIPFGVRAIQSGVDVEGIWISRPVTPLEVRSSSKASSTTLEIDGEPKSEDKGKGVLGRPTATVTEVEPTPKPSPRPSPTSSTFDQSIQLEMGGTPTLGPQTTYLQPFPSQRPLNDNSPNNVIVNRYFNPTTKPRGTAPGPFIETYVPTSSSSSVNSMSSRARPVIIDRESNASDDGLGFSHVRYPIEGQGQGRSGGVRPVAPVATYYRSPFDESETPPSLTIPSSAAQSQGSSRYCSRVRAETRGNAFDSSPERDNIRTPMSPSNTDTPSASGPSRLSLASTRPTPVRTYTTADIRENTQTRRVNTGFEILPAGTIARSNDEGRLSDDSTPGIAR
jgi:hypothetical protein